MTQRHYMTHIYPWEVVYRRAIEETDPAKLPDRLEAAQQAVYDRANTLASVATRHSINELAWLERAIEHLAKISLGTAERCETPPPLARAKSSGS